MEANQSASQPSEAPAISQSSSLNQLLSQARATRQMLLDFKAAVDDCTVHGSHIVHLALGVQFLNQLVQQSTNDIHNIQAKLDDLRKPQVAIEAPSAAV